MSETGCVACSELILVGSKFCPHCGAPQSAPEIQGPELVAADQLPPDAAPDAPPPSGGKSRKKLAAAAMLVLALAGGATAIALTASGGDDEPSVGATVETEPVDPGLDTDGDGSPDVNDTAPNDAAVGGAVEEVAEPDDFDDAPDLTEEEPGAEEDDIRTTENVVDVGEPAVDEDVTFKVNSLDVVSSVPVGEFEDGPITPRSGAKIIRAVVTWKNNTGAPVDLFCGGGGARLLDQVDNNYDPMDNYTSLAGNDICGDDVGPGFKRTDTLLFEIPADQKTQGIALWNTASDEDSGGETFILARK